MNEKFKSFDNEKAQERLAGESKRHQERMAKIPYIEERPELFETKVLRIKREREESENTRKLLVATRDPGSGNALTPVLKELANDEEIQIDVLTDGRAQEIIQKNFLTEDITPPSMVLEADSVIGTPQLILLDKSEEMGIDSYVAATFPEVPKILVEDMYGNSLPYLLALQQRNLPWPAKICVIDAGAKELIVKQFPDLESRVEVTGQPAFDKFAHEDIKTISQQVKERLRLQPDDKLVAFMAVKEEIEKVRRIALALKESEEDFYFVFRRHPRDNVSYETYKQMFVENDIKVVDTDAFTTDEIGAAADVVFTTFSTEGLHGIYRRKPTAYITDTDFENKANYDLPVIPVQLGASVGINHCEELALVLPQLLNKGGELNKSLQKKMEQEYPLDGNNAKRVAGIVRDYLEKNKAYGPL